MLGVPIITQSDPGTENYGVANTQTLIRHRLDTMTQNLAFVSDFQGMFSLNKPITRI